MTGRAHPRTVAVAPPPSGSTRGSGRRRASPVRSGRSRRELAVGLPPTAAPLIRWRVVRRAAQRQTWRRTSRELHHLLSRDGRKWVKEVWQPARNLAQRESELSPLANAVSAGIAHTSGASENPDRDEAWLTVMRTGHATRAVLVGPTEQPSRDRRWFGLPRGLDAEAAADDPAAVRGLTETVGRIATSDFESVMTLPEEVWTAYVVTATGEFQRTLTSRSVSWSELSRETIDELLRCGYVLRCVEEALGLIGSG